MFFFFFLETILYRRTKNYLGFSVSLIKSPSRIKSFGNVKDGKVGQTRFGKVSLYWEFYKKGTDNNFNCVIKARIEIIHDLFLFLLIL